MASRSRLITAGGALLASAGFFGGQASSSGAIAASAVAVLIAIAMIRRGLAAGQLPPLEIAIGVPTDRAQLEARVLILESQLEHAPIALFRIDAQGVQPVNANARRLLAPGRATDIPAVHEALRKLAAGQRSIFDFDTEHGTERALATAGSMTVEGQPQRLVALTPMEGELEAEAMQAWQKLVHVLTHEIMNSLTPVASLSQSSRELLASVSLPADVAGDLDIALDTIARRADSLTQFVSGYRTLASVPEARREPVVVADMFARLSALVGGNTVFVVEPESLELMADPGQLEQALVNLLKNAAEATAGLAQAEVVVSARLTRGGRLRIEVCDNGPGVQDDLIAEIFTPFFSTREKGSGIGLAMVRQLVHRNGGAVRYAKSVGNGARFIVTF